MVSRLVIALALTAASSACSASRPPAAASGAKRPAPARPASATKITAFEVSPENLNVDKVGMRDGALKPDGGRDHAFTATIEGPFDALFVVEVDQQGEPAYGYRADSMTGAQELPREFGGVVDTAKMTVGIGVVEDDKFVNAESGSVIRGEGVHRLRIYGPNTNLLAAGDFVRLYARTPDGGLVAGPVASY